MKRLTAAMAAVLLILAVAMPGLAVARGHGSGNSRKSGSASAAKKGARAAQHGRRTAKHQPQLKSLKPRPKGKKRAGKTAKGAAVDASADTSTRAGKRGSDTESRTAEQVRSSDATAGPSENGLHGIANAYAHILANLARMQQRVDLGLKRQLPPGLVMVSQKFAAWLGLPPPTLLPPGTTEPAPSAPPTDTVEPTKTAEPSTTPDGSTTANP